MPVESKEATRLEKLEEFLGHCLGAKKGESVFILFSTNLKVQTFLGNPDGTLYCGLHQGSESEETQRKFQESYDNDFSGIKTHYPNGIRFRVEAIDMGV